MTVRIRAAWCHANSSGFINALIASTVLSRTIAFTYAMHDPMSVS